MAYGIQGEIDSRIDAYRGNPQQLQQKYAMKQELLDLLALQKIKSEKEAAARDMQLKMAQQQAAQGQPPTVKDQREQEVMNMTKQELAQQVGGLARQKQAMDQRRLQQMLGSGVATLPAPGMARMAGGGIVAFAEGDLVGSDEEIEEEERLRRLTRRGARGPREEAEEVERILTRRGLRPSPRVSPEPPVQAALDQTPAETRRLEAVPAPVAPPTPAPAPGGLASLPGAKPAPSAPAPAAPSPRPPMAGAGLPALTDPMAMQKTEETRVAGLLGLTPTQRRTYDQGVEDLRRLYAEEMDPEAQRERRLSAALRGAANRGSFGSVMAGVSGGAEAERRRSFGQRLKGTEAVQKKLEDVIGIERAAVEKGIGAGTKAGEMGVQMRGQEIQSRDKALDRQVEKQKVTVQAEANAALRDQNNFQRLNTTLGSVNRAIADITQKYFKEYQKSIQNKEFQLQGAKGEDAKKIRKEIDDLNAEMEAVIESRIFDLRKQREALENAIGGGIDTGGFTVRRKQ